MTDPRFSRSRSSGFSTGKQFVAGYAPRHLCTTARSPDGSTGRQWCYVEAQLLSADQPAWNYCNPVTDYDELRQSATVTFVEEAAGVRATVAKLERAQQKGEEALELF